MRRPDVWRIHGVGNAAIDTPRFQAAVAAANAANVPVTFEISGSVWINAIVTITAPVSMRFLPGAEFVRTQFNAAINYGASPTPWTSRTNTVSQNNTTYPTTLPEQSSTLRAPGLSLALGDLVVVWSDTAVTSPTLTPQAGFEVRYIPMELHRIERLVTGTTDTWTFADFTDDPMTTNPFIAKIPTIKGVRIEGLRARKLPTGQFAAGESGSGNFLQFAGCEDLELYDCAFVHPTPGALGYRFCYNVRTLGCRFGALENPNTEIDTIYGIVEAICNRTNTVDCTFDTVRHAYTTGSLQTNYPWVAGQAVVAGDYRLHGTTVITIGGVATTVSRVWRASGTGTTGTTAPTLTTYTVGATVSDGGVTWEYRGTSDTTGLYLYGTNRNFRVAGCTSSYNGKQSGSSWLGMSMFDTHADGLRGVFENNVAIIPAGGNNIADNIGFNVRGRKITIRNNQVYGHQSVRPVSVNSSGTVVADNVFRGGFRCLIADGGTNPGVSGVRFTGNKFIDFLGPGVHITAGTGHEISNNDFTNVGFLYTTSPRIPSCSVYVETLAGNGTVCVLNNKMPKDANRQGVALGSGITAPQVVVSGNVVPGYGPFNQGLRSPVWYAGDSVTAGDVRWASGREYRALTGGVVQATMPTHTTSTGGGSTPVNWAYVRDINLATIVELETRYLGANGFPKYGVVHAPAHGLNASHRYSPLDTTWYVWDDTDTASLYSGFVLLDVISEDHLLVASQNDRLEMPGDLISGSYSVSGNGRFLYWDTSLGRYVSSMPTPGNTPILYVTQYTGAAATQYIQVQVVAGTPATVEHLGLTVSDETTNLTTGTGKLSFRMPFALTLSSVRASVNTAPTGAALIVDINQGGTSLLGTKLSIDAGETTSQTAAAAATLVNTSLADDALITVDIDQVGSNAPGKGLKLWLRGFRQ